MILFSVRLIGIAAHFQQIIPWLLNEYFISQREGKFTYLQRIKKCSRSKVKQGIKNIIFDLGGVIINLDMQRTAQAFMQLAASNQVPVFDYHRQDEIFKAYEVGKISSKEFTAGLIELLGNQHKEQAIIDAWNAMLLDIPAERLRLLEQLKQQYRTFLFSNTNELHYNAFTEIVRQDHAVPGLDDFFEKTYYSHTMGMRKPDIASFQRILDENNLEPEETLFLDDTAGHLAGAAQLGIQTALVTAENDILRIFENH